MTRRVLVTGGSGYIAGFIIRQLIAEEWEVNATIRSLSRDLAYRRIEGRNELRFRLLTDGA